MTYPDRPPQRPILFMQPSFPSSNISGFGPQNVADNKQSVSQVQFEHGPPFKRPKNYDDRTTNYVPFQNARTSQPNPQGTRGTSSIFYKTRMCAKFLEGTCRNGESCTFAHGLEDKREPPPNWQEIIREKDQEAGNLNDDQRIIHRMKICRKFYNGEECPYGNHCNFLHESPSRFKTDVIRPVQRESTSINMGPVNFGPVGLAMELKSDVVQAEGIENLDANTYAIRVTTLRPWKTKICTRWEITGQCPSGDKCNFAHGQSELQVLGGHVDSEITTNIHSFPTKAPPSLVNDSLTTKVEVIVPKQETANNKVLSKWKLHKKINTIYGDWPEDLTPPEKLRR